MFSSESVLGNGVRTRVNSKSRITFLSEAQGTLHHAEQKAQNTTSWTIPAPGRGASIWGLWFSTFPRHRGFFFSEYSSFNTFIIDSRCQSINKVQWIRFAEISSWAVPSRHLADLWYTWFSFCSVTTWTCLLESDRGALSRSYTCRSAHFIVIIIVFIILIATATTNTTTTTATTNTTSTTTTTTTTVSVQKHNDQSPAIVAHHTCSRDVSYHSTRAGGDTGERPMRGKPVYIAHRCRHSAERT